MEVNVGFDDDFEHLSLLNLFPDAKFTVCLPLSIMDSSLSDKDSIVIVIQHTCYCYSERPKKEDRIIVRKRSGHSITYRNAIQALIDYGYTPPCGHFFPGGFPAIKAKWNV